MFIPNKLAVSWTVNLFLSLLEDILLEANCLPPGVLRSKPNGNEGQGVSALQLGPQREAKKHIKQRLGWGERAEANWENLNRGRVFGFVFVFNG